MLIAEVLRRKPNGNHVVTIEPSAPVSLLLTILTENGIGAAVVSPDGNTIAGIASERDVVRELSTAGPGVLHGPVSDIMTRKVFTTTRTASVEHILGRMTEDHFRHVPVLADKTLIGLVSIGDLVKNRTAELESGLIELVEHGS